MELKNDDIIFAPFLQTHLFDFDQWIAFHYVRDGRNSSAATTSVRSNYRCRHLVFREQASKSCCCSSLDSFNR
jgi:hypothetical protein